MDVLEKSEIAVVHPNPLRLSHNCRIPGLPKVPYGPRGVREAWSHCYTGARTPKETTQSPRAVLGS